MSIETGDERPHDSWLDQLSSYLDRELGDTERSALEKHLDHCARCSIALNELGDVKALLASDKPTAADRRAREAWPQLRAQLPARRAPRHLDRVVALLAAASIVAVAILGGQIWGARSQSATPTAAVTDAGATLEDRAARELERIVQSRLALLRKDKSEALVSSLRIIDGAIADARAARSADPTNDFLRTYLDHLMKRKVLALRKAVEVVSAETS